MLADLGWSIRSRGQKTDLRVLARMNEAIVEPLPVEAILRLRSGVPYKPAPDLPTRDVQIVDLKDPSRNSFVATEEFAIRTRMSRSS